ncbi:MAG: hypothetical protein IJQ43_02925 [Oscillospiraceae bacterium]|nr:hypothetical protein [Oscillospiraceae bacterium]MBR0207831.1 hypothetical protein [Oscillospiraceae bacterium]
MAQRTIHYLIGEELIGLGVRDVDRFRVGNVLPDAIEDLVYRNLTHYQSDALLGGRSVRFSDFERFRREFAPLVETDGLYLGYYMHLVEDACYRRFWKKIGFPERHMTREKVAVLHNDYHLLNAYIVRSRGLRDELVFPAGFEREPINRLYPFLLKDFLEEMRGDFTEDPQGTTHYMTEALLEEYLSGAMDVCRDALRRILSGEEPLDARSLTW